MLYTISRTVFSAVLIFIFSACNEGGSPKPKGYFRIDFPDKHYSVYDSKCPFRFDYPRYAVLNPDNNKNAETCWLNIDYSPFNARLHLSYSPVKANLRKFLEDSRTLANKHQIKASSIEEQPVIRDSSKVYGLIFDIGGNTASSLQFYLTDSTQHFLRGALYFNVTPNIDSLAPVVNFLKEDIYHMIQSFEWKDQ